jgi:hypothetical protein
LNTVDAKLPSGLKRSHKDVPPLGIGVPFSEAKRDLAIGKFGGVDGRSTRTPCANVTRDPHLDPPDFVDSHVYDSLNTQCVACCVEWEEFVVAVFVVGGIRTVNSFTRTIVMAGVKTTAEVWNITATRDPATT